MRGVALVGAARLLWLGVMDAFLWGVHNTYSFVCLLTSLTGIPWFGEEVLLLYLAQVVTVLVHLSPVEDLAKVLLVPRTWC